MAETVARSNLGGITYLAPADSLASAPAQTALSEAIRSCIDSNRIQLVLDLDRVPMVDSKAIEIILDASNRLAHLGGTLRLVNASPLLTDILIANGILDAETVAS